MPKTWRDIQYEVLGLFNARTKRGTVYDLTEPSIAAFVKEMPDAYNYAAKDLATNATPLIRTYSVSQNPLDNLVSDSLDAQTHTTTDLTYSSTDPKAYYFECDGIGSCAIEIDVAGVWTNYATITLDGARAYKAYKGFIVGAGTYRLRFYGSYAYNVKNVAMYVVVYGTALTDIPEYGSFTKYDLDALTRVSGVRKFHKLADDGLRFKGDNAKDQRYRIDNDFYFEGDSILYVKYDLKGQFDILYHIYPTEVTTATVETFAPETTDLFAPEAIDAIPYCMAGRIFLPVDPEFAGYMASQYSIRRSELSNSQPKTAQQKFYSESGWV